MSTRYVWEKREIRISDTTGAERPSETRTYSANAGVAAATAYYAEIFNNRIVARWSGNSLVATDADGAARSAYKYFVVQDGNTQDVLEATTQDGNWNVAFNVSGATKVTSGGTYVRHSFAMAAGALIEKVSSSSPSAYPTDGVSGDYWYKYLGSESIDPTAISYDIAKAKGGKSVTVTLTPAALTYGGTIQYQWQYQVDVAAWTNADAATTSTSKSFTVPKGAESFRVRVQASDNMGFTSSDYVTAALLPVQNLTADVGVNNAARPVGQMFIGVNGQAREVVRAFIGVDGKARELF